VGDLDDFKISWVREVRVKGFEYTFKCKGMDFFRMECCCYGGAVGGCKNAKNEPSQGSSLMREAFQRSVFLACKTIFFY